MTRKRTIEVTDPRALRALAHPVRLALIGVLRREGALTATEAGERIGETATTCSFHLRQLARYGLVEEAGGGRGRSRPWRATAAFTSWPSVTETEEQAAAAGALNRIVVERYFAHAMRWLEERSHEPVEWQAVTGFSDMILHATPDEIAELERQVNELVEPFVRRQEQPELRPEGSRPVSFIRLAFPSQPLPARQV